ncbi:MAG: DNA polymerase IV [Candidatus Cloacimonetes bacterium]|nr:DNA polymerase IV [Candidatus Cloacimonadota bacterium]MCF8393991.1 DNA polymerase IV [Melioribacteraceae bacterium]
MRTIFHLDLDAFFVSVERIIDPSLNGKPVIVGGDPHGRGVVAACSYEAREYGLHSAMPIRQAFRLCPNGIYLHGHHGEYSRFSRAVKHILEQYAPMIEQASIDEFYMDFTGTKKMYGSMFELASKLQKEVWERLLLPCSIGIAGNKTVAKISSDYMKPQGITYVMPRMEKEFLAPMPVERIPGVGKVTLKSLNAKGFYTIGDITGVSQDYFGAALGKYGIDLWNKAHGKGSEYLNPPQDRKSISKERTFGNDIIDKKVIEEKLFELTGKVCQMLRDRNWQVSTISIKLRYSDFVTLTRAKSVKPTDDDKTIYEAAQKLFRNAYTRRVGIRLIGIHLSNFSEFAEQEALFEDPEILRKKMLRSVTKIRDKYGYGSINFGHV